MKRIFSLLLVFCLAAALTIPSFAEMPKANAVTELYTAEGSYEDECGNEYVYIYHVPQINDDTQAAQEINAEIAEQFGKEMEYQFSYMERNLSLWCRSIDWESSWSGTELFLLVTSKEEADCITYRAYGYDFATGTRLTNEMILSERGITQEEYKENLQEKVRFMFDEQFKTVPEDKMELVGYDKMWEDTLSWLNQDEQLFIDRSGTIQVPVKIASIAGAGRYYHIATPFVYG